MQEDTYIFSTVEAYCWSRDFNYETYKLTCYKRGITPLCEKAYGIVCLAFDAQMDYDITSAETLH